MSGSIVTAILDRSMTDHQFRDPLLTDPDKALAEHNLTPVEIEAIKETGLAEAGDVLSLRNLVPRGLKYYERCCLT